jgi:putative flippase GtrA
MAWWRETTRLWQAVRVRLHLPFVRLLAGQWLRYMMVGASTTLLDAGLFALLRGVFGASTLMANSVAYGCGVLANFALNRRITFGWRAGTRAQIGAQFTRFLLTNSIGLVLNSTLVLLLERAFSSSFEALGWPAGGYLAAKALATVLVFFWNFTVNRRWTFARPGHHLIPLKG